MGRIFDHITVGRQHLYALFDTGSRNSYVRSEAAPRGSTSSMKRGFLTAIGGRRHRIKKVCLLEGTLRRRPVTLTAYVLPEIGHDASGTPIDVLFGANAMQDFGLRLNPEREELDVSHYHRELYEV